MQNKQKDCCQNNIKNTKNKKGFLWGIFYGLAPHTFCILFIIFSIIGATTGTLLFKNILTIPYFFQILVSISFIFATISAIIYLKRSQNLSIQGLKNKWRYLTILYSTTIIINLLFFTLIFPAAANLHATQKNITTQQTSQLEKLTLEVNIPCSGHASLIIDELGKTNGIINVSYKIPKNFIITYDPKSTSPTSITSLEIFKEFKAKTK